MARFTYQVAAGVLGSAQAVEHFLYTLDWQSEQVQGGEVKVIHISRWESGEIRRITFTFCGNTLTVGRGD